MLNNITETELKPLSLTEKIDQEKRKRNQAYKILDYQLSMYSYFDFFSEDAFIIAKQSKHFAYFLFEGKITDEEKNLKEECQKKQRKEVTWQKKVRKHRATMA